MNKYKYYRGSEGCQESVEFDIKPGTRNVTTCVVTVQLLLAGLRTFPCGNGDDYSLSASERLEVLNLVCAEREKFRAKFDVKTNAVWAESGLSFDEFVRPGDAVDEALVDEQASCVPPTTNRKDMVQVGEPQSHVPCADGNGAKPVYATFCKGDGRWTFAGYCFEGETVNRLEKTWAQLKLDQLVAKLEAQVQKGG